MDVLKGITITSVLLTPFVDAGLYACYLFFKCPSWSTYHLFALKWAWKSILVESLSMALVNPCCPTLFNNILICYEISWWFQWHQIGVLKHQFHLNKWKINSVWDLIQEACYAWDFLLFFSTYLIFCFNFLVSTTVCGEIIWTWWSPFFHIVLLFLSVFYFMLSEDPRNRVSFIIPAQGSRGLNHVVSL